MTNQKTLLHVMVFLIGLILAASHGAAREGPFPSKAVTVKDPSIPLDELGFQLLPLASSD